MTAATSSAVREAGLLQRITRTDDDVALLVLRVGLAVVFFPHGAQKALGWFGGPGFAGFVGFAHQLGVPAWLAVLAILAEFLGSIGLLLGLLGRIAAFGIFCNMAVAIALIHSKVGFFMNWTGKQAGEGFEFHLLAIAALLAVMIHGSGAASVDRALSRAS